MKINFTAEQIKICKSAGVAFNVLKDLSGDELEDIDTKIKDHYLYCGTYDNYEPNKTGLLCESVIDAIYDAQYGKPKKLGNI